MNHLVCHTPARSQDPSLAIITDWRIVVIINTEGVLCTRATLGYIDVINSVSAICKASFSRTDSRQHAFIVPSQDAPGRGWGWGWGWGWGEAIAQNPRFQA